MYFIYKIELDPNNKQVTHFQKAAGISRFAYNWGIEEWERQYKAGQRPNYISVNNALNRIKKDQFKWMYEVSKWVPSEAIENLSQAYDRWFRKIARFPKFKKKGSKDRFCILNDKDNGVRILGKKIRLPILGWVRTKELFQKEGVIKRVTVKRVCDRWFAFVLMFNDRMQEFKVPIFGTVGVDIGIKTLATLSNGEVVEGRKALSKNLTKLKRIQRIACRREKGSKNQNKAYKRLAKLHNRISNIRHDEMHKLTTYLAKSYKNICIEDLNSRAMLKNKRLARHVFDMGFYPFKKQLEYKTKLYDSTLTVVGRFFPSSKTCSRCGFKKEILSLNERVYNCDHCGLSMNRDLNAAINLEQYADRSSVLARGEGSSGIGPLAHCETTLCEAGTKLC